MQACSHGCRVYVRWHWHSDSNVNASTVAHASATSLGHCALRMLRFGSFRGKRDGWYIDDNTEAPTRRGVRDRRGVSSNIIGRPPHHESLIKHTYAHLHGVDVTLGFRRNGRGRVSASGGIGPSAYTEDSRRAISRLSATVSAANASSSASIFADSAASARCLASSRAANALRSALSASYSSMSRTTVASSSVGCAGGVASRTRVGGDAPSAPPPSTSFQAEERGVVGCSSRGPGGGGGGTCRSLSVLALSLASAAVGSILGSQGQPALHKLIGAEELRGSPRSGRIAPGDVSGQLTQK